MINDRIFLGYPINFKDVCKIYPPTVNDVVGNEDFVVYQSLFTITQEELDEAYLKDENAQQVPELFWELVDVIGFSFTTVNCNPSCLPSWANKEVLSARSAARVNAFFMSC